MKSVFWRTISGVAVFLTSFHSYDLDYPEMLEGDDPLSISSFVSILKLHEIQADILRAIVSNRIPMCFRLRIDIV